MFRRPIVALACASMLATLLSAGCDSSSTGTAPVAHEGTGPQQKAPAAGPNSPAGKKDAAKKS